MIMLSLKIKQVKILFIVFISLFAIITTSCSDSDDLYFETMDDGAIPGSKPKVTKECFDDKPDLMDDSINASREIVEHLILADSTRNGFRVVYATENRVTKERLEEVRNRPVILDAFKRLKADAPPLFRKHHRDRYIRFCTIRH